MNVALAIATGRTLASFTTLGLGGAARHFLEVDRRSLLEEALGWAAAREEPLRVLGGGSNLVVADQGVQALVVRMTTRGVELVREAGAATLTVQAGECWDDIVELAVAERLSGIECLTGIPGTAGATPIQNVGAYGQEVSDVIDGVEVLDRATGAIHWLPPEACAFAYRDSRFKREPERFVVLAVRFRLRDDGPPCLRYRELASSFRGTSTPSLREVQQTVRALRAQKGMLIEPGWEPSAGSFFTNPMVTAAELAHVTEVALARSLVESASAVPQFPLAGGRVKLAAGWLVEHAGIAKGLRRGGVGVSSRHALALVHHGGGSTHELLSLAGEIQQQVDCIFGVKLAIEPVLW